MCERKDSWKGPSTLWKSSSQISIIEPWRKDDIDLCVEFVWYTRMRTLSGSGRRCWSAALGSFGSSGLAFFFQASYSSR